MGETRETIRSNLSKYIAQSGYTQKETAEKLGVSKSSVTNWLKGKNSPDVELVIPICNLLNITIRDFYGEDGQSTNISLAPNIHALSISDKAMQLAQDYDGLDEHGRRIIRVVADEELERIKEVSTQNQPQP